jgi:glyoxylase-like metal-dependent hydrolase (beta-lactamase superfamily II)
VLIPGDYISGVEIPMISPGGSAAEYIATLARLAPLVERADFVVPGHGAPLSRDAALRILEADTAYLETLEKPPPDRDSRRQRRIHLENVTNSA